MPIFVYRCRVCGKETEKIYSSVDNAATAILSYDHADASHPEGMCTQERVPTAASFSLKGPGFYANDYPKKG